MDEYCTIFIETGHYNQKAARVYIISTFCFERLSLFTGLYILRSVASCPLRAVGWVGFL